MDTPEKRAMGMQFRTQPTVMLFVHPKPGQYSYHMRNVRMPLDLFVLDNTGRVIQARSLLPGYLISRTASLPHHSLAIEAPAGVLNLKPGDRIALSPMTFTE